MKKLILVPLVLVLFIAAFALTKYVHAPTSQIPPVAEPTETTSSGAPTFEWTYVSLTETEMPHTMISLVARYPDESTKEQVIDTIAGGCNEYEEADADTYERSTMIICYYAGLGHYFKVVESAGEYLVLRKVFEEASPEYDPPAEEFEIVARF